MHANASLKIVLATALALGGTNVAWSAPGDFYPGWGFAGSGKNFVSFDLGGNLADTAVDSAVGDDGSLYIAGTVRDAQGLTRIGVAKLGSDGLLDLSFSGDGKNTSLATSVTATSIALSATHLYVAGFTTNNAPDYDMVVCRFLRSNGTNANFPDNDNSACVTPDAFPGTQDIARDILVQPDGKFVIAGSMGIDSPSDTMAAFARFESNGQRDQSFGNVSGSNLALVRTDETYLRHTIHALARASNGELVAVGSTQPVSTFDEWALVIRLAADGTGGTPEIAFTRDGSTSRDTVLHDVVTLDVPGEDDQLIVAGHVELTSNKNSGFIAKVAANGDQLVSLFGEDSGITVVTSAESLEFTDVALEPNGGIVALGLLDAATGDVPAVRRFDASGERDNAFGIGGSVLIDFGLPGNFHGTAALVVRGDAAYVTGWALQDDANNTDFVAAKLLTGNFMFKDGFEEF